MEELSIARVLLPEVEFRDLVMAHTAALAVDMATGKIIYATEEAERMFHCGIKNGLFGEPYERLIPSELREKHASHVKNYMRNPQPRSMGEAKMRLRAMTLDGESLEVAITLKPVKKGDRLYEILTFQRLPK
jgi:hypothetical protein